MWRETTFVRHKTQVFKHYLPRHWRKQIASLSQSYFLLEKYIIKEAPERQSSWGEPDLTDTGYPTDEQAGRQRTQETFVYSDPTLYWLRQEKGRKKNASLNLIKGSGGVVEGWQSFENSILHF